MANFSFAFFQFWAGKTCRNPSKYWLFIALLTRRQPEAFDEATVT
jgi:hypothetical protein